MTIDSLFDAAVALQPQADGSFLGHTSAAYGNMVGPFGGVTAAQALNAVLQHSKRLGEPISLTVNFAAALADGPFTVIARPARTNRSTQHWVLEIQQQGEAVLTTRRGRWTSRRSPPWLTCFSRGSGADGRGWCRSEPFR